MGAVAVRRRAIPPHVPTCEIAEKLIAACCDERRFAYLGLWITGRPDETRVFVLCDREAADQKLTHVHAMDGTFVLARVRRAHQEIASRNARERRRCGKRQGRVSILFLRGKRLLERRRIVSADEPVADDGNRYGAQAASDERVVGVLVLVDVHHGERRAGA